MNVPVWVCILIAVLAAAVQQAQSRLRQASLPTAKSRRKPPSVLLSRKPRRIVSDAIKTSEAKKKETILEGKDEIHRLRTESEKELNDRRKEIQRQERRVQQKEETLDQKDRESGGQGRSSGQERTKRPRNG